MRLGRIVIAAVLFLAAGLSVLFYFCHGNTGFSVGIPVSATKLSIDLTTTGVPVLVGLPLAALGALLLLIAFIAAIAGLFFEHDAEPDPEFPSKREEPFAE